jgi:hypothetical protein
MAAPCHAIGQHDMERPAQIRPFGRILFNFSAVPGGSDIINMAANLVDNAAGQHVPRSETLDTVLVPIHNGPKEHSVAGMGRPHRHH